MGRQPTLFLILGIAVLTASPLQCANETSLIRIARFRQEHRPSAPPPGYRGVVILPGAALPQTVPPAAIWGPSAVYQNAMAINATLQVFQARFYTYRPFRPVEARPLSRPMPFGFRWR